MKKISLLLLTIMSLSLGFVSCSDDGDYDSDQGDRNYSFKFDTENVPYETETSGTLNANVQSNLTKEVIGYGWKWVSTHEILEDGTTNSAKDFYEGMYGAGPSSFFIESENKLTTYSYLDAVPMSAAIPYTISIDKTTGKILYSGDNCKMRIFSVYKYEGKWRILTIDRLGVQNSGGNQYRTVWGYSCYERMTESELKDYQANYQPVTE